MSLILSGTDGLSDVDGSAATPAIRGTDANTGIFFPAADTIAFSEGGVESMRIDSSGNLGIGTNSPAQKLTVNGNLATLNNNFLVYNSSTITTVIGLGTAISGGGANDTAIRNDVGNILFSTGGSQVERMRIDSSGNVGINTTSSASTLQVNATTEWGVRLRFAGDTTSARATYLTQRARGSFASPTAVTADTIIGGLEAGGYNGSTYTQSFNGGAAIQFLASGNWSTTSTPAQMLFLTTTVGATGTVTERMRITDAGRVYINNSGNIRSSTVEIITVDANTPFTTRNSAAAAGRNHIFGDDANAAWVVYDNTSTGVYLAYNATSWTALSDERKKDIIMPIADAANKVSSLRAVIGRYKKDSVGKRRAFLIAQDVQAVLPEAVDATNPEELGLSYSDTIPLLVAAIKEQQSMIQELKAKVTVLENK